MDDLENFLKVSGLIIVTIEKIGILNYLKYNFSPIWYTWSFVRESGVHKKEKIIDRKQLDEFNTNYFENTFIEIIEDIEEFKVKGGHRKIEIKDVLPIPYMFLLGYLKQTNETINKKNILNKLKTTNSWGNKKVDYIKNFKNKREIIILISESKILNKERFDFNIKYKKQTANPKRSSFNKKSYEKTLISVINEINKLNTDINKIRLKIVASPSVTFRTGEILAKYNFYISVDHYSFSKKKSKKVVEIKNGYDINFI